MIFEDYGADYPGPEITGNDESGDSSSASAELVEVVTVPGKGSFPLDGIQYKRLSNGAIVDVKTGRIVSMAGAKPFITADTAKNVIARREQIRLQGQLAARRGLVSASIKAGRGESAASAWSSIVEAQYNLAIDTDKGRASTEASRFVGQSTGFLAVERGPGGDSGSSNADSMGPHDVLALVFERLLPFLVDQRGPG